MLQYTSNLAVDSMKDSTLMDRQSTALIWEFLALLVRQNGVRLPFYVAIDKLRTTRSCLVAVLLALDGGAVKL